MAFIGILHSWDGNGFIRDQTEYASPFGLVDVHDKRELNINE